MSTKLISVVTPCYNEEANVRELCQRIKAVFDALPGYRYEQIFIDNASRDGTVAVLRELAAADCNVKVILNARNFGHIRSPYYALLQARGDAVVAMASDLQDPPELIPSFLQYWESGRKVVMGVKDASDEPFLMYSVRKAYYRLLSRIADIQVVQQATGFGLYDRAVIEQLRRLEDPYPYFRGLMAELGYEAAIVPYRQPQRQRGVTKNNFYSLYDLAMLGIVSHSKVPLRLATIFGFSMGALSFLIAFGYLVAKLLWWNEFSLGLAPILVGFFFLSSVQLVFVGIIGEYIGSIYTQVKKLPLVVERERINW
jgi:glycosyltransferase involved in cell wall biosynthesis